MFDKIHNWLITKVVGNKPVMMNIKTVFDGKSLSMPEGTINKNNGLYTGLKRSSDANVFLSQNEQ